MRRRLHEKMRRGRLHESRTKFSPSLSEKQSSTSSACNCKTSWKKRSPTMTLTRWWRSKTTFLAGLKVATRFVRCAMLCALRKNTDKKCCTLRMTSTTTHSSEVGQRKELRTTCRLAREASTTSKTSKIQRKKGSNPNVLTSSSRARIGRCRACRNKSENARTPLSTGSFRGTTNGSCRSSARSRSGATHQCSIKTKKSSSLRWQRNTWRNKEWITTIRWKNEKLGNINNIQPHIFF